MGPGSRAGEHTRPAEDATIVQRHRLSSGHGSHRKSVKWIRTDASRKQQFPASKRWMPDPPPPFSRRSVSLSSG
jgi:hypothetical protein